MECDKNYENKGVEDKLKFPVNFYCDKIHNLPDKPD